jgi:acetyl-CoA acyltransferase
MLRAPGLAPEDIGDVLMGCAIPEGEQGMNVARILSLRAGLPTGVPAATINRFCASGLQAIASAVDEIRSGRADAAVAGGTESMSRVAMFPRAYPNPAFAGEWPDVYLGMGLTAENLAKRYGIGREESDRFSLESHRKALRAIGEGKFTEEIVPVPIEVRKPAPRSAAGRSPEGGVLVERTELAIDECPRADTTLEGLAKLKPVFARDGTVTAGNASQMSDGAAAVVVLSERKAKALGLKPLAVLRAYAVAGVEPEVMGIGPVKAVPLALRQAGLTLDQIDIIELNEAFAVQSLAVMRDLGLDPAKVNVNGGAVALGHPLGATGARLAVSAVQELERRGARYALVTMCVGGGMGAAGILERV